MMPQPAHQQAVQEQARRRNIVRPSSSRAQPFISRNVPALPNRGRRPAFRTVRPVNAPHFVPPTRFVRPSDPISTHNFPRPAFARTYFTTNFTSIDRDYRYDRDRFTPHVSRFFVEESPLWGNHYRYGCYRSPEFSNVEDFSTVYAYPYYVYSPFYTTCVATPYYYDPYCPPYLPDDRVAVWPDYNYNWDSGASYRYASAEPYSSYGDPLLNLAIQALVGSYRNRDARDIDNVLGTGDVAIFGNNRYEYSLDSNDFRDMFIDDCRAPRTVGFDVLSVRRHGDYGIVRCRHRFETPDRHLHSATLIYNMRRIGNRYAISDFMTSGRPI
jgi:hypothetical protein